MRGWDDDFDTDFGYSGMVQFAVSLRDPAVADISSSNCFESDNNGTGTTASPFTSAIFSNVSSFGPKVTGATSVHAKYASAMHIRRSSKLRIFNSVFAGWPKGLLIDGVNSQAYATADELKVKNVIMSGMGVNYAVGTTTTWDVAAATAWFTTTGFNNATFVDNTSLLVNNPFNLTAPDFKPIKSYLLNGFAYVQTDKTLTINPGVVVRGDNTTKGTIIIEMGGKLIANGTASQPIVFTSNQDAGSRGYGDWGGIILLGKAPINPVTATIEGGVGRSYGGADATDNSGSLKYVRIEFPGVAFATDNEINGLTMGGVGAGTTLDNIQVSYSGDDSFEWFGGTVNAKHLIALRGWDDDFDTDFGYSGMVQYAVSLRDPAVADVSSSNCFESDNNATGGIATPFTSAIFSNVSSFGPKVTSATSVHAKYASAMHIRRSSKLRIFNSVFAGWPKGLLVDGVNSQAYATAGDLKVRNTVMSGMGANFAVGTTTTWNVAAATAWYNTTTFHNVTEAANNDLGVTNAFNLTAPNFLPTVTSKLINLSYWNVNSVVASLNIPVKIGFTWLSFNALPTNTALNNVLNYSAQNNDEISSQNSSASYFDGVWYGIDNIEKHKMYKLKTSSTTPGSITINNQLLSKNPSINISQGYNWIGNSNVFNYIIGDAFRGNTFSDNDELMSQNASASNFSGVWYPSDFQVNLGEGYILKSDRSLTLKYPDNQIMMALPLQKMSSEAPVWTPISAQKNTMTIYARVYKNNALFQPTGLLLAVFKNDICYGVKGLTAGPGGIQLHQLSMGCNNDSEDGFTYKVYDPTDDAYYVLNESVNFRSAVSVGKINEPVQLNISTTSVEKVQNVSNFGVYPSLIDNTFYITLNSNAASNAVVNLYNVQGQVVKSIYNGTINSNTVLEISRDSNLPSGLYFITATLGNNQYSQKVILK